MGCNGSAGAGHEVGSSVLASLHVGQDVPFGPRLERPSSAMEKPQKWKNDCQVYHGQAEWWPMNHSGDVSASDCQAASMERDGVSWG